MTDVDAEPRSPVPAAAASPPPGPRRWLLPALAMLCATLAIWSYAGAPDRGTWAFEVLPLTAVLVVLALCRRSFRFSNLAWVLLAWFYAIQCVGGRYTFAEVPFPQAVTDALGLGRNPTDRIGHFFQGFVPAILLREWLLRRRGFARGGTLFCIVTACCLAFSAGYELLEMAVVLIFHSHAGPEWLGMQGDPWDAQWDMTLALTGAIVAQLLLARLHDHSMARLATDVAGTTGKRPGAP